MIHHKKLPKSRSEVLDETYNEKRIKLILDLDNTLIYSTTKKNDQIKDYTIMDNLYVYKRPYLDKLLNDVNYFFNIQVSKYCDIAIYTSASQEYANPIIDYIDKYKVISKRLFREDCFKINETYYKDFSKHGFDSKNVIIVDDSPEVHVNSTDHLIPIKKWFGSDIDNSLLKISKTLSNLKYTQDVHGMIKTLININEAQ